MEKEQIAGLIEDTYSTKHNMFVTWVSCKNDINHYGYFHPFDDYAKLKEKNQYRLIPRNNYSALKNGHEQKWKYDTKHSIILNGDDVQNIEFVLPLHI